jgi:LuxR family maltose regulon positive regulatory protein
MLFPFSEQQENDEIQQLRAGVEHLVQSDDETALTRAERNRLRQRLTILDGWGLIARALSDGNVELLHRVAEQAEGLRLDDDSTWQQHRFAPLAMAWRMAGNFPPMVSALQESRRAAQNRYVESQFLWGLVTALIASGRLQQAHDHCLDLQQLVDSLGRPLPVAAYPDLFRAQLAYAWNQLEVAKGAAQKAIEQTTPLQYMDILMVAYEVLVRVCLAQHDLAGADRAVHDVERVYQSAKIPLFRPWVESLQAQLWLAQGNVRSAAHWAERSLYRHEDPVFPREGVYLTLVRVDLIQQRFSQALSRLTDLLRAAEQVARGGSIVTILALQVAALQASGAVQEARQVLLRLLALAEPEGYLRVFLDAGHPMEQALQELLATEPKTISPILAAYAQTVGDAFAREPRLAATKTAVPLVSLPLPRAPAPSSSLIEPLTPREQEVLHLLAAGATNREIADRLVVSLTTVKKHVGSLLLKLAAENRTHAVARARELALL